VVVSLLGDDQSLLVLHDIAFLKSAIGLHLGSVEDLSLGTTDGLAGLSAATHDFLLPGDPAFP